MDTYLITVTDHQKDMKKYYICATKTEKNLEADMPDLS